MAENKTISLDLSSLEKEYNETLQEIQQIKKNIVASLTFQVTIEDRHNDDNFIGEIKESINSIGQQITKSDLAKELKEKSNYLKEITQELEKRRKDLFDNFDATLIPLDKLSVIESLLFSYKKSEYKENQRQQINMAKIVAAQEFSINTPLEKLSISTRTFNCLKAADINTLGDLIKTYKELGTKGMLKLRNFGKNSMTEVEDFLKENQLID